jgi:hypothetical protein
MAHESYVTLANGAQVRVIQYDIGLVARTGLPRHTYRLVKVNGYWSYTVEVDTPMPAGYVECLAATLDKLHAICSRFTPPDLHAVADKRPWTVEEIMAREG